MSTRSDLLEKITTNYVVVVSKYRKIYKMPNFVEFINKRIRSVEGRFDMVKILTGIYGKARKSDQEEIKNIISWIEIYEDFVD